MEYSKYWKAFGEYLRQNSNTLRPKAPRYGNWLQFSVGTTGVKLYAVVLSPPGQFRVDLVLEREDAKSIFQQLLIHQYEIESVVGEALSWEERPTEKYSHIILRKGGFDPSLRESWQSQFSWFKNTLEKFDKALRPKLNDITSVGQQYPNSANSISKEIERISSSAVQAGSFDPTSVEDARERIVKAIVQRRGQQRFRESLLEAYGGHCCISGCGVEEVLEAAHIIPYRGDKTNHTTNGLLLRSDLHTLFDLGLISVDPKQHTVSMDRRLSETPYWEYANKKINLPNDKQLWPNTLALTQRWNGADL